MKRERIKANEEGRHGFAGAPRRLGGMGGHFGAPHLYGKMISSPTYRIRVRMKPAHSVPLTVASSFLPAPALSGDAGPTMALASAAAITTRSTMSAPIF